MNWIPWLVGGIGSAAGVIWALWLRAEVASLRASRDAYRRDSADKEGEIALRRSAELRLLGVQDMLEKENARLLEDLGSCDNPVVVRERVRRMFEYATGPTDTANPGSTPKNGTSTH